MKNSPFIDYILYDLLIALPDLRARAMFGGYGLYQGDLIFAIVVDDQLYFKVSEDNRSQYEQAGSTPFQYMNKDGKPVAMSYWLVPEELLENREELSRWARHSIAISMAKTNSKKPKAKS